MGNVGLLLVGAVLFVNGLASLGVVPLRGAAPLNIMVGSAQILLPTIVLIQAGSNTELINNTWPSYLFGITYLWYGLQIIFQIETQGFGWYSAFVAAIVAFYAVTSVPTDPIWAVMWATWAIMWTLFFILFGLERSRVGTFDLGRFAGWFLTWLGIPTCTLSALAMLNDQWSTSSRAGLLALAAFFVLTLLSVALTQRDSVRQDAPNRAAGASHPNGDGSDDPELDGDDPSAHNGEAEILATAGRRDMIEAK